MAEGEEIVDLRSWFSGLDHDQWATLPVSGPRPSGRYKHAAAVVGDKLYIYGGSRNGRNLPDFQVLDLNNSSWSPLKPIAAPNSINSENGSLLDVLPATSGHHMIVWEKKLLTIDGKSKSSSYITVRFLDLETEQGGVLETAGDIPVAREGQSVTLVGSKLIIFGGEDVRRKLMNDIHILDLETMSWETAQTTQPPPSPRYDHATAVHADRYLLVFGGCSHSTCFNDLHVLDLHTMEWSQPETRGDYLAPRAGHSGVTINGNWYISGGGDNKSGARDTLVLDMTKLVWSVVTTVNPRDPLASEGISICSALIYGDVFLIAFGGYNGRYNNEVFIMRPKIKDSARPKIYQSPAAAAAAASVSAAYSIDSGGKQLDFTKLRQQGGFADSNERKDEKRLLESSLAEVRAENSVMKGKIDDINSTLAELYKELESVQGQLITERSRCSSLEAQIVRFQGLLHFMPTVENELKLLTEEKSNFEQDAASQKQGSGGVWQWFSGGGNSP
ncbi:acyl-CoA-binding domain-containing protein 4 [Silene latifolia]|uniref:acyl-CoA-binding domain-containing protein 4 n=1 Tax=Silene latifolia TaxID=37657 RepID=UPI003D77E0CB